MRWLIAFLAFSVAGWLAFDGAHGWITGDYVTPRSGPYAGQLGPWAKLFESVGLDPRSRLAMGIHLGLGVVWCGVIVAFLARFRWAWRAMLVCAALALWYLPFGTLLGLATIGLLLSPSGRELGRGAAG